VLLFVVIVVDAKKHMARSVDKTAEYFDFNILKPIGYVMHQKI
jgi:hypothetical protein